MAVRSSRLPAPGGPNDHKTKLQFMKDNGLVEIVQKKIAEKTFKKIADATKYASEVLKVRSNRQNILGFYDVTGNMFKSLGFLVTRYDPKNNRLVESRQYAPGSGQPSPTRPTLGFIDGEPEYYDQPTYYGGDPVTGKPFRARLDMGGLSGAEERKKFINELKASAKGLSPKFWTTHCFVAIPYGRYVEAMHNMTAGEGIAHEMANLVREGLKQKVEF